MKYDSTTIFKHKNQYIYFVSFIDNWGVGGELTYYYLTDSVNFTEYLGCADAKDNYSLRLDNDIIIEKYSRKHKLGEKQEVILVETKTYNLDDLKKNGNFDN